MALGTFTSIKTIDVSGARIMFFTQQLTSGANHVEAGSALDLSSATRGVAVGFVSRVFGCWEIGMTTDPGGDSSRVCEYVRAANGATATGVLRIFVTGAAADSALSSVPVNTDLSTVVKMFVAVGE